MNTCSITGKRVLPAGPSVVSAAPPKETRTPAVAATLQSIITPQARDRWLSPSVKLFTPERIEQTIRGAMSGDLTAQWEMFDLMEGTWPRLSKNLNELKDAVKALDWNIQPWAAQGEKPTDEAQRRARLLDDLVWGMAPEPDQDENDFESLLGDVMDAWGKGIAIQEIDWELRPYDKSYVYAPRASRWIHPRYYGYPLNSTRLMINAREARIPIPEGVQATEGFIPFVKGKFIIAAAKHKSGPPIGASLLRLLAFWWCASNFTAEWWLNFAQIFGLPIRWANYETNASKSTIDAICDMLENMGSAGWAAFPAGTTLELKEAMKSGTDNPQAALMKAADTCADILILRQTLTTDAGDKGTQALGTVHQSIRAEVVQGVAGWVARILNAQFVPAICQLNYGNTNECPWFMPALKQVKDAKSMAERDQILLNSGIEFPKSWFYERHDIPIPAADEEVISRQGDNTSEDPTTPPKIAARYTTIQARDTTAKLVENVIEDLSGVEARWLGAVKPIFEHLVELALDESVTDQQLIKALDQAKRQMPELFNRLDHKAVADSLERAMGAAMANGALSGILRRRKVSK